MKIAIIYSPKHQKLDIAAKTLGRTLENEGHRVDYLHIGQTDRPPNVARYKFVYVGSIAEGTFGGKVPAEVADYVRQCHGFQSTKSAAFMMKRLFLNSKGLRRLMAVLESAGSQVMDFETIAHKTDAENLAKRLRG